MFLKLLLNIVIICCSSSLGNKLANRYVYRIRDIRTLQICFAKLETEILYYSTFLPDALENVGKTTKDGVGRFLFDVSKNLKDKNSSSIEESWSMALERSREYLKLADDDYDVIERFGCQLGVADRTSQRQLFEIIQLQLKKQEKKAEEERARYENMYRSLGFLSGLTIVIILF
ncbi:MAG TPA: hypothetical protein GX392_01675 [Clostridiales bacterium]|nr:hypothetical protein [Clostridiales bacterium]